MARTLAGVESAMYRPHAVKSWYNRPSLMPSVQVSPSAIVEDLSAPVISVDTAPVLYTRMMSDTTLPSDDALRRLVQPDRAALPSSSAALGEAGGFHGLNPTSVAVPLPPLLETVEEMVSVFDAAAKAIPEPDAKLTNGPMSWLDEFDVMSWTLEPHAHVLEPDAIGTEPPGGNWNAPSPGGPMSPPAAPRMVAEVTGRMCDGAPTFMGGHAAGARVGPPT